MSMPPLTADRSLYRTPKSYEAPALYNSSGSDTVTPQGCGAFKWIRCGAQVAACVALCASGVGTAACLSCIAGLGSCAECL